MFRLAFENITEGLQYTGRFRQMMGRIALARAGKPFSAELAIFCRNAGADQ
jgi:hypothetical protein